MRIKYSDTSAIVMTWQVNYEEREEMSFIRMKLCVHCFQDYELVETNIRCYRVLFHAIVSNYLPHN